VKTKRDVYFEDRDSFISTPIYDGDAMEVGNRVKGPAIVEQSTTTIVIPPQAWLEVTSYGDYIMHLPD
jgi:N-methylhydantoinase A